jgi:BASS family bile acid:Na+ symporter
VSTVAVAVLLVASMLAVGTAATVQDFRGLAARRRLLIGAVLLNVVVLPGVAVGLVAVAGLGPEVGLGVLLAAAAPGGGTGALLTLHARGDLAVSAGLQVVLAPLGLVAVPAWAAVAGHSVLPSGAAGLLLVGGGLAGQVVPLAVGMWLRRSRPAQAAGVHRVARRVADVLLAGLVLYFVITGIGRLPLVGWAGVAVIAVLVAASLAVVFVGWLGGPGQRRAVAMTTGVRNLTLGLFFAAAASPTVVLTLLAYGLIMYGVSVPVALLLGRSAPVAGPGSIRDAGHR